MRARRGALHDASFLGFDVRGLASACKRWLILISAVAHQRQAVALLTPSLRQIRFHRIPSARSHTTRAGSAAMRRVLFRKGRIGGADAFGFEPEQPGEAFVHAIDGLRRRTDLHGLALHGHDLPSRSHNRGPDVEIALARSVVRQAAQGACRFLEAVLDLVRRQRSRQAHLTRLGARRGRP